MVPLPTRFGSVIVPFAALFRQRTWRSACALLIGAILVPGTRTVASVLRILGLARERRFERYHRVLSRAVWSPLAGSRVLLALLIRTFVPAGPLVFGVDDTIERRWGKQIRARGIYRDPVRSSDSHFVMASGLRWLSIMLLTEISWAGRVWALPVLTLLAPSEHATAAAGHRYKTLVDWARQAMRQLARWCATLAPARADPSRGPELRGAPAAHRAGARDAREHCRLVRHHGPRRGPRHRHGGVVLGGEAGAAAALGARARPRGPLRPAGAALDRPGAHARADRRLLRAAMAGGGDLCRGQAPLGRGIAAPME